MKSFGSCLEVVGLGIFATIPILILTYLSVAADLPLADTRLAAMDGALGFNWLAFIHFVDSHPFLARILGDAYQTISFQLILLPLILIAFGKNQRAYAMITGYAIICVFAAIIAMFYPAVGTYAHYGLSYASVHNINPYFALSPVPDFNAVRADAVYTLALGSASGLICFPSVHAGVAYLSTWAAWDLKWLRYPVALLDLLMIISAVSHANHYLVDIVSGLGVSAFTTALITFAFYEHRSFLSRSDPVTMHAAA